MKTKDDILKQAQEHFGVKIFANDDGISRRIEHYAMDLWVQEVVMSNITQGNFTSSANYDVDKVQKVAADIVKEVLRAKTLFPNNFVNQHEAYAVILEEVDELWDEIKKNQRNYDLDAQRKEATQAAAMLVRLLVELL